NLGLFSLTLALVDGSFAVFGMADALPGAESFASGGFGDRHLRTAKFFPTRGKKFRDVVDGVVRRPGILAGALDWRPGRGRLVFVLVIEMGGNRLCNPRLASRSRA